MRSLLWAPAVLLLAANPVRSATPRFPLIDPGTETVVRYEQYGVFQGTGTFDFSYEIRDAEGLKKASGAGIDPNIMRRSDPVYRQLVDEKRVRTGSAAHWKHVGTADPEADFYAWATAAEAPGVRLYFTGRALEAGGHYAHALKAYRAAMILYPDAYCWNRQHTWTWLIAPAAWDAMANLIRKHPELGLKLEGTDVRAQAAIGGDPKKNRVAVTPGRVIESAPRAPADLSKLKIAQKRGGTIAVVRYENGHWGLQAEGKPFIARGITYTPAKVGKNYSWNWMEADENGNGVNDVAFETWVDKNRNNRQDADEPAVGDFQLMKDMGVNAIRMFANQSIDKALLRRMFQEYGIRVILVDLAGAYTVNSGANWQEGTDYADPDQRRSMLKATRAMVEEYRDEPWLLAYVLGNENNMAANYFGVNATRTQAANQPVQYARFLNEAAKLIHELDPNHPVGVGNLGLDLVDAYAKHAPELDFIGVNSYPGSDGFGALWERAKALMDRPVLITEYGCDAYHTGEGPDEDAQENYHRNAWDDIAFNAAGGPGAGNAIGGLIFEWLDEWWKDTHQNDPLDAHAVKPTAEMAFPDGWSQEEWLGLVSQGDGKNSPFLRQPRKSYFLYRQLWIHDSRPQ